MAARIIARGEWHWQDKRVKRSSAADERAGIDAPPGQRAGRRDDTVSVGPETI
jgi:hypothetical protein